MIATLYNTFPLFLADTMPPKTKKQIAASLNYRKRKDREEIGVRDEVGIRGESRSGEVMVENESTSSEVRV